MRPIEAVLQVLRAHGEPLHYREIAARVVAEGLWRTAGKHPETAIAAALSVAVRADPKGEIRRLGRGLYAVRPLRATLSAGSVSDGSAVGRSTEPPILRLRQASLLVGDCQIEHSVSYPWATDALGSFSRGEGIPVVHDCRLVAPCWKVRRPFPHMCAGRDCSVPVTLARLQVNEFPRQMLREGDDWFWLFDACETGPSEALGGMLDELQEAEDLWDDEMSAAGAVFHFQGLEFNPELRFESLGPEFLRAVLWLLSRTDTDVGVAETRQVALSLPLLWPPAGVPASSYDALTPTALQALASAVEAAGFRTFQASGGDREASESDGLLRSAPATDGTSYYLVVGEDPQFDDGIDGQMCPTTLAERDFEATEEDGQRTLE